MTPITKYACAFILAGGLVSPAWAAQGDAGSGPTTGATATNDAGSGPTKGAATDSPDSYATRPDERERQLGRGEFREFNAKGTE